MPATPREAPPRSATSFGDHARVRRMAAAGFVGAVGGVLLLEFA